MASPDDSPAFPDPPAGGVHVTDVAIVGAGPVGLFAIFECGMLKMRCHVVDVLDHPGGQCTALYPEKPIYDIPAWPRIDAAGLIDRLREQAAPFGPVFHLGRQVVAVTPGGDGRWRLAADERGTVIDAAAVIVAAGVGAFGPNRPPLPGIDRYEGRGVHYYVSRRADFRDKRIVIAGGGDSAVDWALSLAEVARAVYFVHRRDKFRAAPESVDRLRRLAEAGKVELVVPYQLAGVGGTNGELTAVDVATLDGAVRRIEADALLPFFGLSTALGPIADWGLDLDHNNIVIDPATGETSAPGIYAIGDIAAYPGKLKLILTGLPKPPAPPHSAHARVFPDEALHFEYSTTKGVPGR